MLTSKQFLQTYETVFVARRRVVGDREGAVKGAGVSSGRVSIKSVAEAAGVAIGTVSKSLNGDREISEATRAWVQRVAQDLGYRPMAQARGRTGNVAVAVRSVFRPVFTSAFYSEVLAGVEAELEQHDLSLLLTSLKRGDDLVRLVSERRADGVLYIGYNVEAAFLRELSVSTPLVMIDGETGGLSSVVSQNLSGSRAATQHLLSRGRRRLVFVTMTLAQPNFRARHGGFQEVLRDADLESGPVVEGRSFADLYSALRDLFAGCRPDGIVCVNDTVGYTVSQVLETLSVRVPEDVSVVGYDGTAGAEHRKARLSTMRLDTQELGAAGVRLSLRHIQSPKSSPQQLVIPTQLEPGDTS